MNGLLDKFKTDDGYKSYEEVSKAQRKEFADAVNELGEPLSQMAKVNQ